MKKKYKIRVIETLYKELIIEAKSQEEALEIAEEKYINSEDDYILNADKYYETKFKIIKDKE